MANSPLPGPDPFATTLIGGNVSTTTQSFAGNKTFTGSVTISPSVLSALTVGSSSLVVNSLNGFIGINKATPTVALDLVGSVLLSRPTLGPNVSVKNSFATGGSVLDFHNFADTLVGSFGVLNTANTESDPGHAFFYTNNTFDFQIRSGSPGSSTVKHAFKADGSFVVGGNTSIASHKLVVSGKSNFSDILGLAQIETDSLPTASSWEGYIVYDSTTNELKYSDGASWIAPSGSGSGYATIQEEATPLTQRTALNFIGAGVTAADDGGNSRTNVTVHTASAAQEGTVSTSSQTFAGVKDFQDGLNLQGVKHRTGTAAPISGAYVAGDIVWNTSPAGGGNVGWICITSGSPGTWKEFGLISE